MKIQKYLLAALLLVTGFTLSGCFEDIAGPYDGPSQVGFTQAVNGTPINGYATTRNEGSGTTTLQLELIGPHRSTDTQFPVTVASTSTATQGTHYAFPSGTTVTIPANSSFGTLTLNIPQSDLAAGATRTVVLEVGPSADGAVVPAENWKRFTVTIRGV